MITNMDRERPRYESKAIGENGSNSINNIWLLTREIDQTLKVIKEVKLIKAKRLRCFGNVYRKQGNENFRVNI